MAKKTIGGNRLGAGKKMTVDLKSFDRSTHDLGYIWRSTMSAGTLVPIMSEVGLPGDTFDIGLECDVKTHPTIGPLFGSYKVQIDVFEVPFRLYQGMLHNNAIGIGNNMAQVKLPQIEMEADAIDLTKNPDNQHINPSCIFSHLNIRGLGKGLTNTGKITRKFNAIPYLGYWDIYKNYYANKQEEKGAVIHNTNAIGENITDVKVLNSNLTTKGVLPRERTLTSIQVTSTEKLLLQFGTNEQATAFATNNVIIYYSETQTNGRLKKATVDELYVTKTVTTNEVTMTGTKFTGSLYFYYWIYNDTIQNSIQITTFPLKNLDDMRNYLLGDAGSTTAKIINNTTAAPYGLPLQKSNNKYTKLSSQEGLALKTYQSDLFNNWMKTEWIEGPNSIAAITAINTSDGSFKLDTLNLSYKVYEMLNRIAISGGSYDDWLEAQYSHERMRITSSPVYHGGLIKELVFQEVVSNVESSNEESPLGTLAGKGVMADKHKGGRVSIRINEPCYLMAIMSLTPRVDYSQGNKWDVNLTSMDNLHVPSLDEIGFQDLLTDQMASWDTGGNNTGYHSAGKQPAWINYMTNVNIVRGNFANVDNEMFMTLNRRYEIDKTTGRIKDLTTYIDPSKFNFIFAQTELDAQNFWAQVKLDITARRKMSAKIMPNL